MLLKPKVGAWLWLIMPAFFPVALGAANLMKAAYNRAKEVIKGGNLKKGEAEKLGAALKALGAPGEKNGVSIAFSPSKDIAKKSDGGVAYTEATKGGIVINLSTNFGAQFDSWQGAASPTGRSGQKFSPGVARANVLAHEEEHAYQFQHGMTQMLYNKNRYSYERDAYSVGNIVNKAFGTATPGAE